MRASTLIPALAVAVLIAPVIAWSKTTPIDITHSSVRCDTVSGVISVKPSLILGGGATPTVVKVKGTLTDCRVQPNPSMGAFTVTGKFSASLTGTTNDCGAFFSSGDPGLTGPFSVTWKPDQATPITPTSTKATVVRTAGNFTFTSGWGTEYQQVNVSIDDVSVTGAFLPVLSITGASLFVIPVEDVNSISAACSSTKGLTKLHVGFGRFASN